MSFSTFASPLFPCISAQMPLLTPWSVAPRLLRLPWALGAMLAPMGWVAPTSPPTPHQGGDRHRHHQCLHPPHPPPPRRQQAYALTDWLHGVLEDNPDVPILQVQVHADDVDDVIQACTGRANPTVNRMQRRHVGMEGTTLLFTAWEPNTKKAGKDKYPFQHPPPPPRHPSLRGRQQARHVPAQLLSNQPIPLPLEAGGRGVDYAGADGEQGRGLAPPHAPALPLIGTSQPVKQVDIFREVNHELSELGQT